MKTIYKYPLVVADKQTIEISDDFQMCCIQTQHENPCLWIGVNTEAQKTKVIIRMFGTGHEIPSDIDLEYIGTFQLNYGELVFHVFYEI